MAAKPGPHCTVATIRLTVHCCPLLQTDCYLRISELFDWIAGATPQQLFKEMSQAASGEKPQTKTDEYIDEYEVDNVTDAVFDNGDDVVED